jgi:hypothetical protein
MSPQRQQSIEQAELQRLHRVKQQPAISATTLGQDMLSFFKHSVQKRHRKLSAIAECWMRLVPEPLLEHCALESFHAGTLKVIVDSSAHLYELKQLLLAGLQQQLLLACKSAGLRRISLKPGRWYEAEGNERRIRF